MLFHKIQGHQDDVSGAGQNALAKGVKLSDEAPQAFLFFEAGSTYFQPWVLNLHLNQNFHGN